MPWAALLSTRVIVAVLLIACAAFGYARVSALKAELAMSKEQNATLRATIAQKDATLNDFARLSALRHEAGVRALAEAERRASLGEATIARLRAARPKPGATDCAAAAGLLQDYRGIK